MNTSPERTIEDVLLENEALREDNDTLFATNENLIKEIVELKAKLERKERILEGVKLNNGKLTLERKKLLDELQSIKRMGVWEFANTYCSDEQNAEAGRQLARSLLGGK